MYVAETVDTLYAGQATCMNLPSCPDHINRPSTVLKLRQEHFSHNQCTTIFRIDKVDFSTFWV